MGQLARRAHAGVAERDLVIEVGGHGYENFLNADMEGGKVFEQHPEWFGADEKGTRRKLKSQVFCTSNPQAVDYVTKELPRLRRQAPGNPDLRLLARRTGRGGASAISAKPLGDPPGAAGEAAQPRVARGGEGSAGLEARGDRVLEAASSRRRPRRSTRAC
jgi:hypothetical protein